MSAAVLRLGRNLRVGDRLPHTGGVLRFEADTFKHPDLGSYRVAVLDGSGSVPGGTRMSVFDDGFHLVEAT